MPVRIGILVAISLALLYPQFHILARVERRMRPSQFTLIYLLGMAVIGLVSVFLGMLVVEEPLGIAVPAVLLSAGFLQWLIPILSRGASDHSGADG